MVNGVALLVGMAIVPVLVLCARAQCKFSPVGQVQGRRPKQSSTRGSEVQVRGRPITSGKLYWSVGEDGGELTDDRRVEGRVIARDTRLGGWVPV